MRFKCNQDQVRRDSLLTYKPNGYKDLRHFKDLNHITLKTLLAERFADPEERQQPDSPSIQEFYDFMVKYPEFTAHGYATTLERERWEKGGYRITIEGLEGWVESAQALADFIKVFHRADELSVDEYKLVRCWYD